MKMENSSAIIIARKSVRASKARNKAAWKQILKNLSVSIHNARKNNNDSVPHKFASNLVSTMKNECHCIACDIINYYYNRWSKRTECIHDGVILANAPVLDEDTVSITNQIEALVSRKKGKRPKGTTNHSKKDFSDAIISANNEIVDMYSKEKRNSQGKVLKFNTLKNIIREVKLKKTYHMMLKLKRLHLSVRSSRKSLRNINMTHITIINNKEHHSDPHHTDGTYSTMSHPIEMYSTRHLTYQGHIYSSQTDILKKRHCSNTIGTVSQGY